MDLLDYIICLDGHNAIGWEPDPKLLWVIPGQIIMLRMQITGAISVGFPSGQSAIGRCKLREVVADVLGRAPVLRNQNHPMIGGIISRRGIVIAAGNNGHTLRYVAGILRHDIVFGPGRAEDALR